MVVITGDSWGVGEYNDQALIHGPGIASYITHCIPCTNLCRGGGSNTDALDRLEHFLSNYSPEQDDTFLWIVTAPNRCIINLDIFLKDTKSIEGSLKNILITSLQRANTLAIAHNIRLKLIGGLCDLTDIDQLPFSNLDFVVPSWCSLLKAEYTTSILEQDFISNIGPVIKNNFPWLLNNWLNLADISARKNLDWQSMKTTYFKTDGLHPDRSGHMVLLKTVFPDLVRYFEIYDISN